MQLRRRQTSISLVRSVYDPAQKRCRAVTVGRLSEDACDIPAELRAALTASEIGQLERLLAANRVRKGLETRRQAAHDLPDLLQLVAAWYRSQPAGSARSRDLAQLAEASRSQWTEVLAAMCAAGVGRTRRRKKARA